jgi:hypothetical protein
MRHVARKKLVLTFLMLFPPWLLFPQDRIFVREHNIVYEEARPSVLCPVLKGDLNNDGFLNGKDLILLKEKLGSVFDPRMDMNGDLRVDEKDINLLLPLISPAEFSDDLLLCFRAVTMNGVEECSLYQNGNVYRNFLSREWNFVKTQAALNLLLRSLEENNLLAQTYSQTKAGADVYEISYKQGSQFVRLTFSPDGAPEGLLRCLESIKEHLSLRWRERKWPFHPEDVHPWIMHLSSSYQNYGDSPYFHHGVDFLVAEHTPFYLPFRGYVTNIRNYTPGIDLYWEVEVTELNGLRWQYHHADKNSIPAAVYSAYNQGTLLEKGTNLGYTVTWPERDLYGNIDNHLHLNCLDGRGNYMNPLNFFIPLADHTPPEIMEVDFCQNEQNIGYDDAIRAGKTDIIVRVRDLIEGSPYELPVFELGIEIARPGSQEIIVPYTPLYRFIDLPAGSDTGAYIYTIYKERLSLKNKTLSTCGDYDCRKFYYVVTNNLTGTLGGEANFWETYSVPGGDYILNIYAWDHSGNLSQRSFPVAVVKKNISGKH